MQSGTIFISHSAEDALIAAEICAGLEQRGLQCWIAPRDVPGGVSYPLAIVEAIRHADLLVLVLTEHANRSRHTLREVERASSRNIPIVPFRVEDVQLSDELEYFVSLSHWLDAVAPPLALHLPVLATAIQKLIIATDLPPGTAGELGAAPMARLQPTGGGADPRHLKASFDLATIAERQSQLLRQLGTEVLDFICHRPDPAVPISTSELFKGLVSTGSALVERMSQQQFVQFIADAKTHGCTPGLVKTTRGFFVLEENIAFKVSKDRELKADLGMFAAGLITSGMRIAMDGGSTTLPLAESLAQALEDENVTALTILTNSLPVARQFADLVERHGWTDDDAPVRVLISAGWLRPNTQAIAEIGEGPGVCQASIEAILDRLGGVDCSFVGGNGITATDGVTMGSDRELHVKRLMLAAAEVPYILADISKFGIHLPVKIAGWDEPITVITNRPSERNRDFDLISNQSMRARLLTATRA
jgi:DeoR/GlpR family transcriptional regulator of sugar metabolism